VAVGPLGWRLRDWEGCRTLSLSVEEAELLALALTEAVLRATEEQRGGGTVRDRWSVTVQHRWEDSEPVVALAVGGWEAVGPDWWSVCWLRLWTLWRLWRLLWLRLSGSLWLSIWRAL
jgi:hypothetical protein